MKKACEWNLVSRTSGASLKTALLMKKCVLKLSSRSVFSRLFCTVSGSSVVLGCVLDSAFDSVFNCVLDCGFSSFSKLVRTPFVRMSSW